MSELRRNPGASRATLALPVAAFLALHPIGAHAETVNVLGDPFGDPSASPGRTAIRRIPLMRATAPPLPAVDGGSATATATTLIPSGAG